MYKDKSNVAIKFPEHWDKRGDILIFDRKYIPFEVKHSFFISNVPDGTIRGNHAHKQAKQVFTCLSGVIDLTIVMSSKKSHQWRCIAGQSIYLPNLIWSYQTFWANATAFIMSSHPYDKNDYINDLEEYYKEIKCESS
jgi:dTDP-4-dehydrorhamnose 3,5-epimerase-like enzyme